MPHAAERLFAGRYRPTSLLGAGAQGVALRVQDALRPQTSALLKVGLSGDELYDGTLAEFEALLSLSNPWIAPVIELGFALPSDLAALAALAPALAPTDHPRRYLVRAWVEGPPLLDWIAAHAPALPQRLALLAQLAQALAALHACGITHGDLKPAHVLVIHPDSDAPEPRLIDFGLAASAHRAGQGGTLGYLAPERLLGAPASPASDRFALGVVLVQALVGQSLPARAVAQPEELPQPLLDLHLPARVVHVLARLLHPDPALRPDLDTTREALHPLSLPAAKPVGGQLPFLGQARMAALQHLEQRALRDQLPPALLLVADPGEGRSRALRQLAWSLQRAGRQTATLEGGAEPWSRFLALGRRLAAMAGLTFAPPDPAQLQGDHARWLQVLAQALLDVLPPERVELFWDDPGADLWEGTDAVQLLALLLERAPRRLRLWGTATPARAPSLRPLLASAGLDLVPLPPLARGDLDALLGARAWGRQVSPTELDRAFAASAGNPARLSRALLGQPPDAAPASPQESLLLALAGLPPLGATRAELCAAAQAGGLSEPQARATFDACLARGLLHLGPARDHEPTYEAPPPDLAAWDEPARQTLGRALSAWIKLHPPLSLLAAGLRADASALAQAWRDHGEALRAAYAPGLALSLLEPGLSALRDPDALEGYTDAALSAGQYPRALAALAAAQRALEDTPRADHAWAARLGLAHARLGVAAGEDISAALEPLVPALAPREAAQALLLLAHAKLRRGAYDAANHHAHAVAAALGADDAPAARRMRAEADAVRAIASALQGDANPDRLAEAREALEQAHAPARDKARFLALCAMTAQTRGALERAAEDYAAALAVVERHGLEAERPLYLLNLGTAYERLGRLSLARAQYDLGSRSALPTTRASTRALLLANRANLDLKLGRLDEAQELLEATARVAPGGAVARFAQQLSEDLAAERGAWAQASEGYARLAQDYALGKDKRRECELRLKAGLAAARGGDAHAAREALDGAEQDAQRFDDLKPRAAILRAEVELAAEGATWLQGLDRYLKALDQLRAKDDHLAVLLEARHLLARLARRAGGPDPLAWQEARARAEASWRRVALTLTPDLRDSLARHVGLEDLLGERPSAASLPTATLGERPSAAAPPMMALGESSTLPQLDAARASRIFGGGAGAGRAPSFGGREFLARESSFELAERFYRLLSIQRQMLGETELARLIPAALAVALELSGAERGFLLLREGEGFRVAFSRDADGLPIERKHLDISESIARQVALSGQTVVTTDASADARFGQAVSVQRLQLTAVLCVPIRGPGERALGCVYLDHAQPGRSFLGHAPKMLEAFADQVALALQTARLVEDLRQERDELARAQTQVRRLLAEKEGLLAEKEGLLAEKEERLLDLDGRCERLEAELLRERGAALRYDYSGLIAQAPAMRRVLAQLDRVVEAALPIVIQGESGTGKELIARALHFQGPRQKRAFVAINCGALSESLLESELFGHKRGAFTGATEDRKGLFEAAQGGTLFLDEVGEMSLTMQVKLLRALQERRVRPVGAVQELAVDARVVAATNRDLRQMVAQGTFREDLYYRLATLVLQLPPLRERREDLPLLVRHLLERACQEANRPLPRVTGEALDLLLDHDWPGNIRQLENVVRAAVVLSDNDIEPALLASLLGARPAPPPPAPRPPSPPARSPAPPTPTSKRGRPTKTDAAAVKRALEQTHQDRPKAAELLGISLRTLTRHLRG